MLVQRLLHPQILVVVPGLRDLHNWLCLVCQKRHVMNERGYLHWHHKDLLPQLPVQCTMWLWNKSQLQNLIAHVWSFWKPKMQQ